MKTSRRTEKAGETMSAVRIHRYGGPEVLQYEVAPRPEPQPGEVVIRVHAAGVNPLDWKIRAGSLGEFMRHSFPLIPGWDFSGVVEKTGQGVTRFSKGDHVYGMGDVSRDGAYAEYIAVRESVLARKPQSLHHVHAAAVPMAALTAWQSLFDIAQLQAGQHLLIHAAAGGVGHFAVQLAKWKGARVTGTTSTKNHKLLYNLGADELVDYAVVRFESLTSDIDVVLDTIGGDTQERSWKVLKPGGLLVSLVQPPSADKARFYGVRAVMAETQPSSTQLAQIARLIDSGEVKPVIDRILPLSEARRAHQLSQTRHIRGKLVLRVMEHNGFAEGSHL